MASLNGKQDLETVEVRRRGLNAFLRYSAH
jgi:hypothetical protein